MFTDAEYQAVAFRPDNTEGYTSDQLDELNEELSARLSGLEPFTYEWYVAAKHFSHEVARR